MKKEISRKLFWPPEVNLSRKTGNEFHCCDVINRVKRYSPSVYGAQ